MRRAPIAIVTLGLTLTAVLAPCRNSRAVEQAPLPTASSSTALNDSVMSVGDYAQRLRAIAGALRSGNEAEARARIESLEGARIEWRRETLAPDRSLLQTAHSARGPEVERVAHRIERLARAVIASREAADQSERADGDALARLALQDDWQPSGNFEAPRPPKAPRFLDRMLDDLNRFAAWIKTQLKRLYDFLLRLWPKGRRQATGGSLSLTTIVVLVFIGIAAFMLALLAARAVGRVSRAPLDAAPTTLSSSRRDEDPLSRETSEWERYAHDLATAGRRREAIRAWYHAVLVSLFRAGLLHYDKGRTNWEYVSALSPELSWRAVFVDLTRGFDREWYGHDASSEEALLACARSGRVVLRAVRDSGAGA